MSRFVKTTIISPASFPRDSFNSTKGPEDRLKIVASCYSPKGQTIVYGQPSFFVCPANGLQKELYEPFFDELLEVLNKQYNIGINYILAIDYVNQGESYVQNSSKIGDNFDWSDNYKDVLTLFNYLEFTGHGITRSGPLIGVGHSIGGNAVVGTAEFHPRLFSGIMGIEPMVVPDSLSAKEASSSSDYASLSVGRRQIWPSRDVVRKGRKGIYNKWDDRVWDRWVKHGFVDLPTPLFPNDEGVTLATPVVHEINTFLRINLDKDTQKELPLVRSEPQIIFTNLNKIQQPIFFLLGKDSFVHEYEAAYKKKFQTIPSPFTDVQVVEGSHFLPQEHPGLVASKVARFSVDIVLTYWKESRREDKEYQRFEQLNPFVVKCLTSKL